MVKVYSVVRLAAVTLLCLWIMGGVVVGESIVDMRAGVAKEVPNKPVLRTAVGYSTDTDSKVAVRGAYSDLVRQLENEPPCFIILYSTLGYDQSVVLAEVNRLAPQAKIYGYTSLVGTMTNDGFHVGGGKTEGYSLAMMGFASDGLTVGVGGCTLDEASSPRETGRIAATRAIKDARKGKEAPPKLTFIASAPFGRGMEEQIIAGMEDVLGEGKVQIVGGIASGDKAYTGGWAMFANGKIYESGAVAAAIYTDVKVGYMYLAGFNPNVNHGRVTKFRQGTERVIEEIDDKPAGQVLNGWLNGLLDDHLGTSDVVIPKMGVHPMGIKTVETGGHVNWALIYVWQFHPDNSITVGVGAPVGSEVYLLEGDPELLIKRPALTARLARSRGMITSEEIAGVVMDHCGGTMRAIPEEKVQEMVPFINDAIGNAPFIGTFNSGNYGHFVGLGNRYGNMMVNMVVFGKK